jgi:hypothetical protein
MGAYRKFSDTWRRVTAPAALGVLDGLGGVDGRFALGEQRAEGAPKASKIEAKAGANAGYTPPKPPKASKVLRYQRTFFALEARCPEHVDYDRWQEAIADGKRFLATWGAQAEALGWTSANLFCLHTPPEQPHPSYSRLSRYDYIGLCWLLQGRCVTVLTEASALIENPATGTTTLFRKNQPSSIGAARR